jgi:PAS domain S-box-containing protein
MSSKDSEIAIELLENSPDAMMALSAEGTVVYWNKGAEDIFGYSKVEAIGRELGKLIIPADRVEEEERFLKEVLDCGRSGFESIRKRKDGSLIDVEISTRVIRNDQGDIKYLLSSKKDITATNALRANRQFVDEELQASEIRYRRLFESAKDGILILDADSGRIIDANPYLIELLGSSKDDLVGRELWQLGPFNDVVASRTAFIELQERGYTRYENLPLQDSAGIIRQVEFVSNSYLAGESRVIQCNIRDITERKLAEEDLRRTNQRLEGALAELLTKTQELASMTQQLWQASKLATMGELAASVAHELNNPLATISLHTELLVSQLAADDPDRHSLEMIEQEVERMATLVGNLLLFSRRSHKQISTLNLCEELTYSINFIQYHLTSHNIELVNDCASALPSVQADRQQLHQVFLNLISNASDAMPTGGTLTVTSRVGVTACGQPAVVIEFSDTGMGVQPGDLPKLWEPFFTTKPEGRGTGLGLSICRRIVEEHRGTIGIETGPGKGATVRITLPATDEDIQVADE